MRRTLTLSLAFLLAGSTLAAGQRRAGVRARPPAAAAAATPCDKAAAHPDDPEAAAAGVGDDRLDAAAAVEACEAEAVAAAAPPRIAFQLARGYLKAERVEEAVEHLLAAAKGGHGGALAYLADLHMDGAAGLDADPALAHSLYQRAAAAGFAPAKAVLAEFEDYTDRVAGADGEEAADASDAAPAAADPAARYINPEIVENVLKGDLDAVPFGELYTKLYLVNMAENISETCQAHFTVNEVRALKQEAALKSVDVTPEAGLTMLMGTLMSMAQMTQNPGAFMRQQTAAASDTENLPEDAMKDAFTLMGRHACGSRELSRFSRNLASYVRNEGAPLMSTNEMYAACQNNARPTGRYDAKNFCMCFVGAMTQTGVSRADRKGLSSDFWATAQRMMANKPDHYAMCNR